MKIQYGHILTLFAVLAAALGSSVEDVLVSLDDKGLNSFVELPFFRLGCPTPSWTTSSMIWTT